MRDLRVILAGAYYSFDMPYPGQRGPAGPHDRPARDLLH